MLGWEAVVFLVTDIIHLRFHGRVRAPVGVHDVGFGAADGVRGHSIGMTLSIQFALLAAQVGATSLAGAASGLAVIRQGAPMVAALLMARRLGSAVCADLGSRKIRENSTRWR